MESILFQNVSAEQYGAALAKVAVTVGEGVFDPSKPTGEVQANGYHFKWAYNTGNHTLQVSVIQKPFLVPIAMIRGQLGKVLADALKPPPSAA